MPAALRQFSGCCGPPVLDRMQLLRIFLRIAYDLSLRQAIHPQLVRNVSAFAAGADAPRLRRLAGLINFAALFLQIKSELVSQIGTKPSL
jgi:hypothetical protein